MAVSVNTKADLRKEILEKRKHLPPELCKAWDAAIFLKLQKIFQFSRESDVPDAVYCYISVRGETGTETLIDWLLRCGVRVAVPRVSGKEMSFFYIKDRDDLIPGTFGIPEPAQSCERAMEKKAPVIVPGVAFSRTFSRIGYGAGYYDRFFALEPEHEKIAICYDFQLRREIPAAFHDISMDLIITEKEHIIRNKIVRNRQIRKGNSLDHFLSL